MTTGRLRPCACSGQPLSVSDGGSTGQMFLPASTRSAASVPYGEAHSWWTADPTNRAVPWVAYRNGCDPSPPSWLPSLLRPGVLNVPCFLACTGPPHPIPHCCQLLRFSVLLPPSWKIGRGKVPTESTPTSSDEQGGQVVDRLLGKPSIGRKPFQKKKKLLLARRQFSSFMLLRMSNPESS